MLQKCLRSSEERKKCEELAEAAKIKFQAANKEWKEKNKGAKVTKEEDKNGEEDMGAEDAEGEEESTQSPPKKARKAKRIQNCGRSGGKALPCT